MTDPGDPIDRRRASASVDHALDVLRSTVEEAQRMEEALRLLAWRSVRTPAGRAVRDSSPPSPAWPTSETWRATQAEVERRSVLRAQGYYDSTPLRRYPAE